MIRWLVESLGSKKLAAVVGGVLATLAVPILNAKLGLHLDASQVATSIGAVVGMVLTYVAAQWHIDVATGGRTTTAALVAAKAAAVAADVLPANTIADKLAKVIADALQGQPATADALAKALAGGAAAVAGPSSAPSPRS